MLSNAKIAVTVTMKPHNLSLPGKWKKYIHQHFGGEIKDGTVAKLVVVTPERATGQLKSTLQNTLAGTPKEFWAEMEPGALGPGDAHRAACFFGFNGQNNADNIPVDYVLMTAQDIDFGNPHANDVQANLRRMLLPLEYASSRQKALPSLVIGDYIPMIWDNDTNSASENPFKNAVEASVRSLLKYYFPNNIMRHMRINRPRSEFFLMGRALFEEACERELFSPYDPMPKILLYAQHRNFSIAKVNLGRFYETDPRSGAAELRRQVVRAANQISADWQYWAQNFPDKTRPLSLKQVGDKVAVGMRIAYESLDKMMKDPRLNEQIIP